MSFVFRGTAARWLLVLAEGEGRYRLGIRGLTWIEIPAMIGDDGEPRPPGVP